ncbi:hypothetical protein Celaphus_00003828 [Cervus elaphus hippelaphus]|uniref:E3 ubiquitin-protein ligase makorin 1 C-terminal domain-containing protein n=1 Tax=Cervus elaphus hippelaphus TaxID=46360 RepID=A0A212D0K0_CEREH|nr:hypothetical protein Celaphus_00003828 [Cervus elaphus hippelaphus]
MQSVVETKQQLCPYAAVGERRYGENCACLHGDACDTCGLQVLHLLDAAQRSEHIQSCIEAHEDMELSFAVQRSKDMVCSNCMEVVYEKANPSEHRLGVLSNCCLKCIRKWRSAKKTYFDEGRGSCPFGRNYFYKRAYPDGCREEPQNRKWEHQADTRSSEGTTSGSSSRHQRTATLLTKKIVTFELGEMLFMLLAAGGDDDLADAEDEWDLFHDELEDFYDLDL